MLPAVAVWIGCLIALWAPSAVGWTMAGLLIGLGAAVIARSRWEWRHQIRMTALATPVLCATAAMAMTMWTVQASASDPMLIAADSGRWVIADVELTADPAPVDTPTFGRIADDPRLGHIRADDSNAAVAESPRTGTSGDSTKRWRVKAQSVRVFINVGVNAGAEVGAVRSSSVPVTIFASDPTWALARAHQTVRIRGGAAPDAWGVLPGATMRVYGGPTLIEDVPWFLQWAGAARTALAQTAAALDNDQGGLLRGLVVGDTGGISESLSDDAKTTGLTHLVAVSGSHLALVAGIVLLLVRRFGPWVSGVSVTATFAALVMVVGAEPSVVRSVAMGLIGVVAAIVGRTRAGLSALAAAVFGLLLFDPALAGSVGFALSVLATAGLILLAPVIDQALRRRGLPPGWAAVVALPVAAHLVTVPVIAAISGSISFAAVPANIVVAPVVSPALLLGLICLIVGPWWPDAAVVIARVDGPLLGWISGTAHTMAAWPWASVPWSSSAVGVVLLAIAMAIGFALFQFRRARAIILASVIGASTVVVATQLTTVGWPGDDWIVTLCDVGQGDGVVLATEIPGEVVVVDVGPPGGDMDGCLDRLGAQTIRLLVLTHLHADHVGGLSAATAGRNVRALSIGPDRSSAEALDAIASLADERGIPITRIHPGDRWKSAGLELTVLGPRRAFHGTESDANNHSVVLTATRRDVRVLLTGDIEEPAQRSLLESGIDLSADVLKQPHHGSSKLLQQFVDAVSPRVVMIGVGADNEYGHPSPSALRMDRQAGAAAIARTDEQGDIQVLITAGGLATAALGRPASMSGSS